MDRLPGPGLCLGFAAGAAAVLLARHLPIDLSVLSTAFSKMQDKGKQHPDVFGI